MSVELGKEIKSIRKALGYSQTEMGAKIGVSFMSVHRWERGACKPHKSFLKKIQAMAKRVEGGKDE